MDRKHFEDLGKISVFVLRCRAKEETEVRSVSSSGVDDSILQTSEPKDETPAEDHTPSSTENPEVTETEPDMLLGFMNDGAADVHQFGFDGEGPGPSEQRAWSWNTPHHPPPAGTGSSSGYAPGQPPPPAQTRPYGSYGHPSGFAQGWQPQNAVSQERPAGHRPQRRVHFNDQVPPQPSGYEAYSQQFSGQNVGPNPGQSQERDYPPQPGNYGYLPQSGFPHPLPIHGPAPNTHANTAILHGGLPSAQDHSRGFTLGPDSSYPAPTPSYQPIGYGVPGYTGWSPPATHPAYAQPAWPGQFVQGPGYMIPPHLAAQFQAPHPYQYPHSFYAGGPVAPMPPAASSHPGGGVWGPPPSKPGSQDPAKDENNQLDGQSNQNQDSTSNAGGQSNDNNSQVWGNANTSQTQDGGSGWNSNDAGAGQSGNWGNTDGGGQTDTWNNTTTQTEAPTNDWSQPTNNTGQTNDADSTWNSNANTTTQVQDSWATAAATTQPNEAAFTVPQQAPLPLTSAQGRPLYGPHGPYYDYPHTAADHGLRADAGEEPPYDVPADMPTTHQVKPGEGYMYVHKRRSPQYLDTLEEPYAQFVFKYRTKGESSRSLKSPLIPVPRPRSSRHQACFSDRCEWSDLHYCGSPTVDEYWPDYDAEPDYTYWTEADANWNAEQIENETGIKIEDEPTGDEEKRKLQAMEKDELIDMFLRAKVCSL
jgi:hypothetical protein